MEKVWSRLLITVKPLHKKAHAFIVIRRVLEKKRASKWEVAIDKSAKYSIEL
jgi:hypothetical protein